MGCRCPTSWICSRGVCPQLGTWTSAVAMSRFKSSQVTPFFQRLGLISGAEHIRRQVLAENSSVFRYIYDRLVIFVAYYSPRVEGPAVTPIRPPYYLDIRSPQAVTAQHRQEAFHHRTICFKSFFETCLLAADLTACGL